MSDPYLGEIRMFGGNFAPVGWAMCQGQLLPISENDALYSLLGTTYGGDGVSTFGVPDLRGRAPLHQGTRPGQQTYVLGQLDGAENVTLGPNHLPSHTHSVTGTTETGNSPNVNNMVYGQSTQIKVYTQGTASRYFAPVTVSTVGGGQPHDNMQPYLVVNFIIALAGIYPSQN